jgi:DNA-binding CsgD family transcriptional regulator
LARAGFLSASIGLELARAQVLALEAIGLPAAVLGSTGKVLAANELITTCGPALRIGAGNSLVFHDASKQELFGSILQAHRSGSTEFALGSIAIRGNELNSPAVAHIIPLRRGACDIFRNGQFIIYLTRLLDNAIVPQPILKALFDLSSAEARVAERIAAGNTLADIGKQLSVSVHTIRAQLKSIFEKTGVRRQADLIRLLTVPSSSVHNRTPD